MRTKALTTAALMTALALILSYLESLIPLPFAVPGIKLGLPNAVTVFALYRFGGRRAALLSGLRVLLAALLLGSLYSLAYAAAGAALSLLAMALLKTGGRFSPVGVSVAGAVAHNLGQILMAALLLETGQFLWYFPALCLSGTVSGVCIGLISGGLLKRLEKQK